MLFRIDEKERSARTALVDGGTGESWTYSVLCREVEDRAVQLKRSSRALLFEFCRNDLSSVAWYLAAIESGHVVALLSDRLADALRADLIDRYRPDWIYSSGSQQLEPTAQEETELHPEVALLLSTSGSTGSPKFVRLTRRNIEANAESIMTALGITADHRPIAHLPIHYSYGLSVLNSHLLAGATVVLTESGLMSAEFWQTIREHQVNSFSGVPYTYQMLRRLGLAKVNVPGIRIMTQAGGKMDPANIAVFHEQMVERGGTFWVMYGQTEATARIAILNPEHLPEKLGSAGQAIPGGRLAIRGNNGQLTTEAGVEGELVYEGPNVMMGYAWGRADLAKGDELNGHLETGDRAHLDAEGFVHIQGRAKRDAKLFGLRVNLDEVEAFIRPHGPAAAVAGGAGIVIFCEFGDVQQFTGLVDQLSGTLKIHRSAFSFRRIERLPVKETGKISYSELEALL